MKLFGRYLRQRWKGLATLLLFGVVFTVSFWLYHLPVGAVLYPALLCGLLGFLFVLLDYIRVHRKHRQLLKMCELTAAMLTAFPHADGVEEADYQALVRSLQNEIAALETTAAARYQDMMDYYTVWVHQIKTPIASMRLTLQQEDTPHSRKLSSDLFRIEQYVEMVLAFLRLDARSSDYVFREYALDGIVKKTVRKFAAEFIDRKIRLDYSPPAGTIVTDEKWLSFVVEQVLSNALKYTREGGCIKIYGEEPHTLCITDTGIGIAPEDLPRIFEQGYTGYNGRRNEKASGIGLYLCRRICKNLGASIAASSVPDRGTTIRICLEQYPLKKE